MADEAKKPEAKEEKKYPGPQWGRAVKGFRCLATASYQEGGQMVQSGAVDRAGSGVAAMELHPLGVLISYRDPKRPPKLVPVGGLTDIDLA